MALTINHYRFVVISRVVLTLPISEPKSGCLPRRGFKLMRMECVCKLHAPLLLVQSSTDIECDFTMHTCKFKVVCRRKPCSRCIKLRIALIMPTCIRTSASSTHLLKIVEMAPHFYVVNPETCAQVGPVGPTRRTDIHSI
jgi:hypothetical protein